MLFSTWQYGLFLPLVLLAYYRLAPRGQNLFLLAASYLFYGWWDWRFLGLLALSTVVDFHVARRIPDGSPKRRKRLLALSLGVNLGILGLFKYAGFFVQSTSDLLESLGFQPHLSILEIVLPVGISFYTFQTMAYTIDVYRERLKPTQSIVDFALYVSYFPQLVAGPIERAQNLLPQLSQKRTVNAEQFASGSQLILVGLFRKLIIADFAADQVDQVFTQSGSASWALALRGIVLFALQIYGDFAGYSAIARGTSRLLGVELMENFQQPYFSTNIATFWRRWHISLSTWLRDYLYIPLGGNRGSTYKTYRNLMLTMLLGGLWHGAGWNFVIWGGIHGVALSIHRALLKGRRPEDRSWSLRTPQKLPVTVSSWVLTMMVVLFAWTFFRAPTFEVASDLLLGIATLRGQASLSVFVLPAALAFLVLLIDIPQFATRDQNAMMRFPWWLRGPAYAGMILMMAIMHRDHDVPFIYFQF